MVDFLEKKRDEIEKACDRHGVSQLDVFGSVLREEFSPNESDLDFLVEFKPMEPYARVEAYFGLLEDLRGLFGRRVDLIMAGAVKNRYIASDIERTKQLLYAA